MMAIRMSLVKVYRRPMIVNYFYRNNIGELEIFTLTKTETSNIELINDIL